MLQHIFEDKSTLLCTAVCIVFGACTTTRYSFYPRVRTCTIPVQMYRKWYVAHKRKREKRKSEGRAASEAGAYGESRGKAKSAGADRLTSTYLVENNSVPYTGTLSAVPECRCEL